MNWVLCSSLFQRQPNLLVQCQPRPIDKMVKVGVNGFGRIGRLVTRAAICSGKVEVVAINDPFIDLNYMVYMFQPDSTHGKFNGTVKAENGKLVINGKPITIFQERDPTNIKWGEAGAEYVVESTGVFTTMGKAGAHLKGGAKRVLISTLSADVPMFVMDLNHENYDNSLNIVSSASCTTNCLAPMAKALNDLAPIQSGIMTTVHAYTGDQMILDGPQRKGDLRRSRAGACNIVPNSTGAAKAIGLVIPELNGKLIGSAQRVPTPTGSTTILVAVVKGEVTKEGINAAMKAAATESFAYNEDEIVSSDVIGSTYGSIFDATQTMVSKMEDGNSLVQVVSWYDNENSYTSQMVRTIKYFSELA